MVITEYFKKGFEYSAIVEMLEKEHNVTMSIRTLKSRLDEYGLKRRNVVYDEGVVRQRIDELLNGPGPYWKVRVSRAKDFAPQFSPKYCTPKKFFQRD